MLQKISQACPIKNIMIFLFCLFVALGVHFLRSSFSDQMDSRAKEVTTKTAFIARTKDEVNRFNQKYAQAARPIKKEDVDFLQNNLIAKMAEFKLDVTAVRTLPQVAQTQPQTGNSGQQKAPPGPDGVEIEAAVTGTWENTMKYLYFMQNNTDLIILRTIRMESTPDEIVKTTYKYKIYWL